MSQTVAVISNETECSLRVQDNTKKVTCYMHEDWVQQCFINGTSGVSNHTVGHEHFIFLRIHTSLAIESHTINEVII